MSNIDPTVIATATGASAALSLPAGGEYAWSFTSDDPFVLKLQRLAGDGVKWYDVYENGAVVTIDSASGRQGFVSVGGTYRLNVSSYVSPITGWAIKV